MSSRFARPTRSNNRAPLGDATPDPVRLALTGSMAQRDFTTLPDSRSVQNRAPKPGDTQFMPIVERTIVLSRVRTDPPPPSSLPERLPAVDPTEMPRGSWGARAFRVLLPPRVRTYRGGLSAQPWDGYPDSAAPPDGDTPTTDVSRHLRRVVAGFRATAATVPPSATQQLDLADQLAKEGDERFALRMAAIDAKCQEIDARLDADLAGFVPDVHAERGQRLAAAYQEGGTSAALYTTADLAREIARRAITAGATR